MDGAIAATCKNRVAAPAHSILGLGPGASGRLRFQRLGLDASIVEQGKRLVNGRAVPC
jgi:hypothetical protein